MIDNRFEKIAMGIVNAPATVQGVPAPTQLANTNTPAAPAQVSPPQAISKPPADAIQQQRPPSVPPPPNQTQSVGVMPNNNSNQIAMTPRSFAMMGR